MKVGFVILGAVGMILISGCASQRTDARFPSARPVRELRDICIGNANGVSYLVKTYWNNAEDGRYFIISSQASGQVSSKVFWEKVDALGDLSKGVEVDKFGNHVSAATLEFSRKNPGFGFLALDRAKVELKCAHATPKEIEADRIENNVNGKW